MSLPVFIFLNVVILIGGLTALTLFRPHKKRDTRPGSPRAVKEEADEQ